MYIIFFSFFQIFAFLVIQWKKKTNNNTDKKRKNNYINKNNIKHTKD